MEKKLNIYEAKEWIGKKLRYGKTDIMHVHVNFLQVRSWRTFEFRETFLRRDLLRIS